MEAKVEDKKDTPKIKWKKPSWLDSQFERVGVTGRTYDEVISVLRFPQESFKPGSNLLSVGEGLSNFARTVAEKYSVSAYATDPIYEIEGMEVKVGRRKTEKLKLFFSDPEKVDEVLKTVYGPQSAYLRPPSTNEVPLPDPKKVIPGSVYDLPFKSDQFDYVFGVRIYEHMNVERALPELLRVVRTGGELRLGGCQLDVDAKTNEFISARIREDGSTGEVYVAEQARGVNEAIKWLARQDVNCYVLSTSSRRNPWTGEENYYSAGVLIFRKDDEIPKIERLSRDKGDTQQSVLYKVKLEDPIMVSVGYSNIQVATLSVQESVIA